MFAKWPIHAEQASLRRVNAVWLSRSERRAFAYSTLRPPTFSGDSLASAVWLTVRPNGVMKLQDVILKAIVSGPGGCASSLRSGLGFRHGESPAASLRRRAPRLHRCSRWKSWTKRLLRVSTTRE